MSDFFNTVLGSIAGPLLLLGGLFMMYKVSSLLGVEFAPVISIVLALTPIILPLALFYVTFDRWIKTARLKFMIKNGRSTLRVHLPQEVFKSPEAMERVMSQVYTPNAPDNLMETYFDGKTPLNLSFELVSIGGEVRFYINTPTKKVKNFVEAQLYAQYPGIEVVEEELDYTSEITWDLNKYDMISFHMGKKNDEILPIKTYIDYGLDKMPKEEEKVDPMAGMIEVLGKVRPHERVWIQILAVPHVKKDFKNGNLSYKPMWNEKAEKYINDLMKRDKKASVDEEGERQTLLTMGEKDRISAIERNVGKYAYEVGIRWMYITEVGKFDGDIIGPIIRTFSEYDLLNRNSVSVRWRADFDYNFLSDFSGAKRRKWKREELLEYKLREYTYRDRKSYVDTMKVMSVEELATIYHIPGSSIITPSLPRITSTRKEAPTNLPTGSQVGF